MARSVVKPSSSQASTVRLRAAWSLRGRQLRGAAQRAVGPFCSLAVVLGFRSVVIVIIVDIIVDMLASGFQGVRVCGTRAL